jgi:hypothetical protein
MPKNPRPAPPFMFPDSAPPVPDRRAQPRFHAVCLDVKVSRGGHVALFRARNISDAGIMLNTHVELAVGEHVLLGLAAGISVRGTVLWCNERCCGIQFERPIDCAALLQASAAQKREDRRAALRLPATKLATTYAENGIRAVRVVNASHRGLGLAHDGSLSTGMLLKLIVETGIAREAAVRWSRDGQAGVRLTEPLTCAELERLCGPALRAEPAAEWAEDLALTD